MHKKKRKMTLQRAKNLVHGNNIMVFLFTKKKILILIYIVDMAIQMSNFDNFDNDHIASKLAPR